MKTLNLHHVRTVAANLLALAICVCAPLAHGQTLESLHSFHGEDGRNPYVAELVQGSDGNFYGTTYLGGDLSLNIGIGNGTVFKMTPAGTLTTLVLFNGTNGAKPVGGLVQGRDGNFYGTTAGGGDLSLNNGYGYGTVFRMTPAGELSTLALFNDSSGAHPHGTLVLGSDGNFYGTTGGNNFDGTVFKMTPTGALTTLARFDSSLATTLIQGRDGALYGTTVGTAYNRGTVFKVSTNGGLTTLVTFHGSNGSDPEGCKLVEASDGNFYGTTYTGGNLSLNNGYGYGTVFKMTPAGDLTTLIMFNDANGAKPLGGLVQGRDGNFYGTTRGTDSLNDRGTVFQMTTNGTLTTLASFIVTNGATPEAGLVQGIDGNFYGTTYSGGEGYGTVFRIVMPPALPPLDIARSGNQIVLSWPTNAAGFVLETADSLSSSTTWSTNSDTPIITGDQNTITVSNPADSKFYRLRK